MQFNRQIVTKRPLSVWNSLIQASTRDGLFAESLHLYCSMLRTGIHGDNFTFPFIAKACAKLNSLRDGTKIHGHVLLMGFQQDVFVQTALIDMYSKCSNLAASRQVFDEMTVRSLVSWNSIISTYCREFQTDESFWLLKQMQVLDIEPNSSTFVSLVLGCCGSVSVLRQGLSIHGCVFKLGCDSDLLLSNSIMSMYVRFDIVDTARSLFDSMEEKSNVSWTTIMGGYLKIGDFGEVFNLFNQMQQERISLDSITFVNLVSSCAQIGRLSIGSSIHSLVIKSGCDHEDIIATSLVSMYSKCGDLISARKKFDSMHAKSVFLWTSMIGGYVHGGHANEALNLFENLLMTGVQPNEVTITTVLSACAYFGSLGIGKRVEEYVKVSGFEYDLRVQTSLIHMYCKCGCIERAKEIFNRVSNKDLAVWSSMINAYAIHGKGEEALTLFGKMQGEEGIKPDAVIFTGVLLACSHSGLVEEGLKYFCSMERDFNVKPSVEHYSCLVDLLGRAGCFSLALKTILEMPIEAQARAWAPLLSACRTHRKIQLGEYVAKRLFESDPSSTANYILMANMYASVGKWKEAAKMRRWMNDRGLVKEPGWSKIEVDGLSHVFLVGDQSHHRSVEIYEKLEELNGKLREAGYAAETNMVMHDLETEEKENALKVHSERLAVAFGLLATETGSKLTIIKNLRTCCDCHSYLKFVSRVTGRHLIVRDGYRFHHFECGVCSCGEFW
ncbi:pentatricopeptide repeat-containing protein At3g12770-like [Magnolia sinica]|uniref:pentatricopeptide repeat-containing protein At3g12770-like n=1 Tax=Magnolia sinica TaxID=86752 RepID=UPI00265B2002|nr:pentatricopeptide repeat-containing protein At3g12770-like [Magnolia sinica]